MKPTERIETAVPGLDDVLVGGFPAGRTYLVQGSPGAGKTTLALQFLLRGRDRGERVLYVTLSESAEELAAVVTAHDWTLDGVDVFDLSAAVDLGDPLESENTLYVPAEVELGERMRALIAEIDRVQPTRMVLDSCSELRLLAQTALRFRRQVLALKTHARLRNCTLLLIEQAGGSAGDELLQSLVHGAIHLEQRAPEYGPERRRLRVLKLREVRFRGGWHDFVIEQDGLVVYPRLIAAEHRPGFDSSLVSSGLPELDRLMGGGLDRGTSYLFLGPAGTGKSLLSTRYAVASAERGDRAALLLFDESLRTMIGRSEALGMPVGRLMDEQRLLVRTFDPAEVSPGEFVSHIRDLVERQSVRVLVIDSLNGYLHAMAEESALVVQLHELMTYLRQAGVLTILVVAQHGLIQASSSPVDASYLADGIVLFRFFEVSGRVHKAVSVLKKRSGPHEDTIRELRLDSGTLRVGSPLEQLQGVLTGVPSFTANRVS